jgi:hypothetical protein
MSKPDVEPVHEEYFRVYYRGRIFDVHYITDGWTIGYANATIQHLPTEEDVIAWLTTQTTFTAVPKPV